MKNVAEERKLHRMAKVHDFLEMWQGSQNLHATKEVSRAQNKQMTAVGYILDMEEIITAFWSLFQHDGAAAFTLSERSPLPPPLSAKDLAGGRTQTLTVHRTLRINRHPVQCDDDCAPESISDPDDWPNWSGDLHSPNDSEDDCGVDVECHMEQDNSIDDTECADQRAVSAEPNVLGLIRPTRKLKRQAEKLLMTVD